MCAVYKRKFISIAAELIYLEGVKHELLNDMQIYLLSNSSLHRVRFVYIREYFVVNIRI